MSQTVYKVSRDCQDDDCDEAAERGGEEEDNPHRFYSEIFATANWKLWIVFGLLVASGVGNVIFAKLQSLPM